MLELEHKIFIIQCYYRTGQKLENGEWVYSINRCIEEFQQQFPNLPVTYAQLLKQIQACVIKFGEIGAVTRKPGGGAPKKRTANLIEDVQQRMEHSPKKSVATLSQQVGLSVGTCHTILKKDLKLFPYKIQAVSELKEIYFDEQADTFIQGLIEVSRIQKRPPRKENPKERSYSYKYYMLKTGVVKCEVCLEVFLSILSVTQKRLIRVKKLSAQAESPKDMMGRNVSENALPEAAKLLCMRELFRERREALFRWRILLPR
ncbi:iroquois-class homeodomain protein irx [Holotrichia oblita]|uniref:Iroquois-class homeodomain protein irx n=1 Tax=Holotrichia oblita TaxID=644536 RepID=A0ACB9TRV5_HOLOL|nr:iroquois-class homeodomain protein irx [Holotrichia oblita]